MLYLYGNITPNTDDKHYYFNNTTQYKNALSLFLLKTIALDNYRINTNIIKVAIDADLSESEADTITYAIDERITAGNVSYFRAYHVNRILIQSGFAILYCSVDLWASYIYKSTISNLVALKCNRKLSSNGEYKPITRTKEDKNYITETIEYLRPTIDYWLSDDATFGNDFASIDDVYIVFLAEFNIKQQVGLIGDTITATRLLAVSLRNFFNSTDPSQNVLMRALAYISGVYGVATYWGDTNNAKVIKAWVLPAPLINIDTTYITFNTKNEYENGGTQFNAFYVLPSRANGNTELKYENINNDINYSIYFGVENDGLELVRYTEDKMTAYIKSYVSGTNLKIIAQQGENQKDITNNFEIELLTSVTAQLGIEKIASILNKGVNDTKSIATNAIMGNDIGVGVDVARSGLDLLKTNKVLKGPAGSGNALSLYYYETDIDDPFKEYVNNPICATCFKSIFNENDEARLFGASFNELTTLTNIFSKSLLGSGTLTDTFLKASCNVDGIPTEASDLIKSRLNNGIYLVNLIV